MIPRETYISQIRPFMNTDLIKVLTGIRRSGKSAMLELIKEELQILGVSQDQFISINFEDLSNSRLLEHQIFHDEILTQIRADRRKKYLFLDEIQELPNWEKAVNSFRINSSCDIYITGSNATLLSGELATFLAGRYVEIAVFPFSFKEFLYSLRQQKPDISIPESFSQYLKLGGFPFLGKLSFDELASKQYLRDVYSSVVLKDIVKRNNIRDVDMLERLIGYVLSNIGQPFSATSISKFFLSKRRKIAPETILNYLRACSEAYLFHVVPQQDLVGKQLLTINEKYYVADHGLRQAVFLMGDQNINLALENIVCIEMLRRGYKVTSGRSYGQEVDFVCENSENRQYIQVAYMLNEEQTIIREFGALQKIKDNYPKYVLSLDEFDMSREGIKHQNIRGFLLGDVRLG